MAGAKRKLLVIEDGMLTSMALNDGYIKEFPFLAGLAGKVQATPGCSKCSKAYQEKIQAFGAAKVAIAGLASDRKRRLKELLNTEQIRVTYRAGGGKIVQLTF